MPVTIKKVIETWKKYMPNYEIKRWDEKTCNIDRNPYIKDLVKNKKYTFASDWCRVNVVYQEGGIYFDTDFILTDSIESLFFKLRYDSGQEIKYACTDKSCWIENW